MDSRFSALSLSQYTWNAQNFRLRIDFIWTDTVQFHWFSVYSALLQISHRMEYATTTHKMWLNTVYKAVYKNRICHPFLSCLPSNFAFVCLNQQSHWDQQKIVTLYDSPRRHDFNVILTEKNAFAMIFFWIFFKSIDFYST